MRRLKLFPKTFLYTLAILLLLIVIVHALIYLLAPGMQLAVNTWEDVVVSIRQEQFVTQAVERALPFSVGCSVLASVVCSLLFSRAIAGPIKEISAVTGQMMRLDPAACCPVRATDEIGALARNLNELYGRLLATIEHLEHEKDAVRDMEHAKVDFLRAASHELKTPVTALSVTLENMMLGVGKYREHSAYLPECKAIVDRLSEMLREILDASKMGLESREPSEVDLSALMREICEPYQVIAAAHQVCFQLDMPDQFPARLPEESFRKALSNILSNAVSCTNPGGMVSVCVRGRRLQVENECDPIPEDEISQLFEPFYRPDFSRSRQSGGNGLGLYIVDGLLTAMGLPYTFAPMERPVGMRFTIDL